MTLALKASAIDDAVQLAIIRSGFRANYVQTGAKIEIDGHKIATSALSYPTAGNAKRVTHLINVDPGPTAALRTAKTLKVAVKEGVNDTFPLEPSVGIWKELQACVARVRDIWNVGEEHQQRIATLATGDLQSVFTGDDYPLVAVRNDQQGTAAFIILVDEKGVPTAPSLDRRDPQRSIPDPVESFLCAESSRPQLVQTENRQRTLL